MTDPKKAPMDTLTVRKPNKNEGYSFFRFPGTTGETLVTLNMDDGTIEYGEEYDPDAAARLFWDTFSNLPQDNDKLRQLISEILDGHDHRSPEALARWLKNWSSRARSALKRQGARHG